MTLNRQEVLVLQVIDDLFGEFEDAVFALIVNDWLVHFHMQLHKVFDPERLVQDTVESLFVNYAASTDVSV